ncbi:hypothetical protein ES703_111286 [subsurface metagenome]
MKAGFQRNDQTSSSTPRERIIVTQVTRLHQRVVMGNMHPLIYMNRVRIIDVRNQSDVES